MFFTASSIFAWWTTVAGVEAVTVRLETYEIYTAYNNPTEADFVFQILNNKVSQTPNSPSELAEFVSVETFIVKEPESQEKSDLIGREFRFKYQKRNAFGRQAETLGTAAVRAVYAERFQVNEETINILPIDSVHSSRSKKLKGSKN